MLYFLASFLHTSWWSIKDQQDLHHVHLNLISMTISFFEGPQLSIILTISWKRYELCNFFISNKSFYLTSKQLNRTFNDDIVDFSISFEFLPLPSKPDKSSYETNPMSNGLLIFGELCVVDRNLVYDNSPVGNVTHKHESCGSINGSRKFPVGVQCPIREVTLTSTWKQWDYHLPVIHEVLNPGNVHSRPHW